MLIHKIHHVAYRCKDAKQTVQCYEKNLGMKFVLATKAAWMHDGSVA